MSNDLRVALRIQAQSGTTRREIQAIERDLRKAGKEGAKALADGAKGAGDAMTQAGQQGAASYKILRQAMRDTAQGQGVWRQGIIGTTSELKQLGQIGRQAARETRNELVKAAKEGADPLKQSVDKAEVSLRKMAQTGGTHLRTLRRLAAGVSEEFRRVRGLAGTAQGQLAGLGVGVGVAAGMTGSAQRDRLMIRTQQTADMTVAQREAWRAESWRIARTYGGSQEGISKGFGTLIASGIDYKSSMKSADAIGQAAAVSGADEGVLGKALVAGSSAFNIKLDKDGAAQDMLEKMLVAGRLGNAELEDMADLFPKIGGSAAAAGMKISQALAFVSTLSKVELQPDRLGTLAESTLRIFTNKGYRDQITKSTGVGFFNKDGTSRNPAAVMGDLRKKYNKLKTDEQRARFMGVVFKGMDQDSVRGWRYLLTGTMLEDFNSQDKTITGAKATIGRDLKDNVSSATGTAGRMKATIGDAIDRMARPLNESFADLGSYLLDDMKLSGEQMLGAGIATGIGGYYAGRGLKAGSGALLNKFLGGPETLKNIAVGKVLEQAAGVTSVFVTNWPATIGGGGVGDIAAGAGAAAAGTKVMPYVRPAAPLALLALTSGSSENTDEGRLNAAQKSKLLDDGQRTYQTAFYRNRIDLAKANPDAPDAWISEQAQRLTQEQTGLAATGTSAQGARDWAAGAAARITTAGLAPMQPGGGAGQATENRLRSLLDKPLVLELRLDNQMIQAEIERRTDIQMRRGQ
ncbi:phage tail tape measure protein [Pseudomonas oryzihabitans]|uniref:Phage tail protein n=1 Tax=Pseudomonas oryzihabitans TaxID=47885 RepID=A0A178LJF5_9PSED|nr:phage tail tape measure protein [Pseudomonas oryzihabitans]OAN31153.1 phage tail protein [Pseudomonas oryzihabitans]